jgi:hypothetical protein
MTLRMTSLIETLSRVLFYVAFTVIFSVIMKSVEFLLLCLASLYEVSCTSKSARTFSITTKNATLSITAFSVIAPLAKWCYAECRYVKCRYAECLGILKGAEQC